MLWEWLPSLLSDFFRNLLKDTAELPLIWVLSLYECGPPKATLLKKSTQGMLNNCYIYAQPYSLFMDVMELASQQLTQHLYEGLGPRWFCSDSHPSLLSSVRALFQEGHLWMNQRSWSEFFRIFYQTLGLKVCICLYIPLYAKLYIIKYTLQVFPRIISQ